MDSEAGFDGFLRARYPRLVAEVFPVVANLPEAQDVARAALTQAASRWALVRADGSPDTWVRRTAFTLASSSGRRIRREPTLSTLLSGSWPAELPPDQRALVAGLSQLPMRYRSVLTLRYTLDLTLPQLADELAVPTRLARYRLTRGRRRLADLLDLPVTPPNERQLGALFHGLRASIQARVPSPSGAGLPARPGRRVIRPAVPILATLIVVLVGVSAWSATAPARVPTPPAPTSTSTSTPTPTPHPR